VRSIAQCTTAKASVELANDMLLAISSSGIVNIKHFKNRHVPLPHRTNGFSKPSSLYFTHVSQTTVLNVSELWS
jgi:hypothetical protein